MQPFLISALNMPDALFTKSQGIMTGGDVSKCSPVDIVAGDLSVDRFALDLGGAFLRHLSRLSEAVHHNFLRGGSDYEEG